MVTVNLVTPSTNLKFQNAGICEAYDDEGGECLGTSVTANLRGTVRIIFKLENYIGGLNYVYGQPYLNGLPWGDIATLGWGGGWTEFTQDLYLSTQANSTISIYAWTEDGNAGEVVRVQNLRIRYDVTATVATTVPTVTTEAISNISGSSATGHGTVTADGNQDIIERGICWNIAANPTTANYKATSAGQTGVYTVSMGSLAQITHYFARAYAINGSGTSYGSQVVFDTLVSFGSVYFTSTPPGARIWIDNVDQTVNTPNTISGLSLGSHTYKLVSGIYTATGSFTITADTTTNVPVTIAVIALSIASDIYTCAGTCQVTITTIYKNNGNTDITFRPAIMVDTNQIQSTTDITIAASGNSSPIAIVTPILPYGAHSICPVPN